MSSKYCFPITYLLSNADRHEIKHVLQYDVQTPEAVFYSNKLALNF